MSTPISQVAGTRPKLGDMDAHVTKRSGWLTFAGVDFHGVHDWSTRIAGNPDVARTAFESSPMASVRTWRSPVLLIHGDDDRNVPFTESVTLAYELRKRGVPVEELIFPDEVHDFLLWRNWVRAYRAADESVAVGLVDAFRTQVDGLRDELRDGLPRSPGVRLAHARGEQPCNDRRRERGAAHGRERRREQRGRHIGARRREGHLRTAARTAEFRTQMPSTS